MCFGLHALGHLLFPSVVLVRTVVRQETGIEIDLKLHSAPFPVCEFAEVRSLHQYAGADANLGRVFTRICPGTWPGPPGPISRAADNPRFLSNLDRFLPLTDSSAAKNTRFALNDIQSSCMRQFLRQRMSVPAGESFLLGALTAKKCHIGTSLNVWSVVQAPQWKLRFSRCL